jgi:uncharacterized protein with FMN-binding domain
MRRVILAIASTAVVLVLLLLFKSHSPAPALGPAAVGPSPDTAVTPGANTPGASTPAGARTVTGDAIQTIYGPVQVKITVANGKVTAASAIEYPDGTPRDSQINSFAIPQLQQETIGVSSPNIDAVSGATYTSQGYIGSLQSALDKAGL